MRRCARQCGRQCAAVCMAVCDVLPDRNVVLPGAGPSFIPLPPWVVARKVNNNDGIRAEQHYLHAAVCACATAIISSSTTLYSATYTSQESCNNAQNAQNPLDSATYTSQVSCDNAKNAQNPADSAQNAHARLFGQRQAQWIGDDVNLPSFAFDCLPCDTPRGHENPILRPIFRSTTRSILRTK